MLLASLHALSYDVDNASPGRIPMNQFGDKFRKAREAKELSLDDVSNVTKISPRMLQAIEEENFDRLPGGVFNKGFIRAYAKHLGLDAEEAITEYLDCLHQAQVAAQQAWEPMTQTDGRSPVMAKVQKETLKTPAPAAKKAGTPSPVSPAVHPASQPSAKAQQAVEVAELPTHTSPTESGHAPRTTFTPVAQTGSQWRLVVVAGLIFILGIALWTRRSHSGNPQPQAVSNPSPTGSPSIASPSGASPTPTSAISPAQRAPATMPSASPAAAAAGLLQSAPEKPQLPKSTTTESASLASAIPTVEEKNDVTIRTFGTPAPRKPDETAAASFNLVIRAAENSWLSVIADGQQVRQETLIAPAHTSVHASREIIVKVGNAAGVSFLFNGSEISPQGAEAEPKTLVFDSSGLKTTP